MSGTQIKSKGDSRVISLCYTPRTGVHVLHTKISSTLCVCVCMCVYTLCITCNFLLTIYNVPSDSYADNTLHAHSDDEETEEEDTGLHTLRSACTTDYDFAPSSLPALAASIACLKSSGVSGVWRMMVHTVVSVFRCGRT